MAQKPTPIKGKKAGSVKPLMKRVEMPAVKPLLKLS